LEKAKGIAMNTVVRISSLAVCLGLIAMLGCETGEVLEGEDSGTDLEERNWGTYNTVEECRAIFHKGDGWISYCDGHGGWANPNAAAAGMTCKKVDCERNASHDTSVHFFHAGCYCKDGYRGPDPNKGLDPLPPGCNDAKAGKIAFCQKSETCRGSGTRTVNGYSCADVNRGFAALVCSGMFSDKQWQQMRSDCCFSAQTSVNACATTVCDREGRLKCKELDILDTSFYGTHYRDLQAAFQGDVTKLRNHYLKNGISEGRQPNARFCPKTYLRLHPDVARAYGATNYKGAVTHWINSGMRECRRLK
jgi:hypothetical protein